MILTVAFVMAPQTVLAQQAPKTARIGWLASGGADRNSVFLTSFSQAMRELGYLEGNNLIIEARYAAGQYEKLPALAAEVIALKPDILVTEGTPATQTAKRASSTIPIVMTIIADPVAAGSSTASRAPAATSPG